MKKAGVLIPELLHNLKAKPVTLNYPFEKVTVPDGFRGTPRFVGEKCIGCKACIRDCTAEAIDIQVEKIELPADPVTGEVPKPQKKIRMILYLDRCVHCARCAEVCPKEAIFMDTEFEVANFTRAALRLVQE